MTGETVLLAFAGSTNAGYDMDFPDPAADAIVARPPRWAFGLRDSGFGGSPAKWTSG